MSDRMDIQDTAFVICHYRASDVVLSGDRYAHLWVTPQAKVWADGFLDVSRHESQAHCLRNRFFLEALKTFMEQHPDGVLVNIGAGFSLYPHLLEAGQHRFCDVDHPSVVDYKRQKLAQWEQAGHLPPREIHYLSGNLEDPADLEVLASQLRAWIQGAPTFFLIEGVLFFLHEPRLPPLFDLFRQLQRPGDQLGAVSFVPEILGTQVFLGLLAFLATHFGAYRTDYVALPVSYYEQLPGYRLLSYSDECALSRRFSPERLLTDPLGFLNEHVFLLERRDGQG